MGRAGSANSQGFQANDCNPLEDSDLTKLLVQWSESQHSVFVVVLTVPLEDSVEGAYVVYGYSLRAEKKGAAKVGCALRL